MSPGRTLPAERCTILPGRVRPGDRDQVADCPYFFKMATTCINDVLSGSLFDGVAQLLLRGPQASVTGRGYGKPRNGQRSGISVSLHLYSERT